jgi:outer membrane receptor protein involved in Fe transport
MIFNLFFKVLILLFFFDCLMLHAEEPMEEISVISERIVSNKDSSWSISSLTADELAINPAEHIQQVLNRMPGVNLQRGNGAEYLPSLRSPVLTGAGACGNLVIMEEGVRVRGAGSCNINELFDVHFEQAQQVDIFRSPTNAFHGANAIQGVMDIRLGLTENNKMAIDISDRGFKRFRGQLAYQSDSIEESIHKGALYFTVTDDDAWRATSGLDQQKLSWRHEYLGDAWSLKPGATLVNMNQETAGFIIGKDAFKDKALAKSNPSPEGYRDSKVARFWMHAQTELNPSLQLLLTPYIRHTDMDFLQHFLPGDPLEKNQQKGVGLQTSFYQTLNEQWQLNYGADFELSNFSLIQQQDIPTQGSPFLVETIPVGKHYDYEVDSKSLGFFLQANGDISQYLSLSLGLRAEQIDYNYTNFLSEGRTREDGSSCGFGGCRYNRPASGSDRFSALSPNMSLSFKKDDFRWFAALGENIRAPQTTELYRLQRDQNKANLESVRSHSLNIGFETINDNYQLRVEAYSQKLDNLIIRDVNFFNVDNAKAKHTGLEVFWEQNFDSWQNRLTLNFAKHQYSNNQVLGFDELNNPVDVSGNIIDTAPRWFGRWQLQKQFGDNLLTQFEVEAMGKYYLDPENEHEYEGHTLLNWNMVWNLKGNIDLRIKINNLLDKPYASRADFTGFSGYRYFPGEPRTFVLGVTKYF